MSQSGTLKRPGGVTLVLALIWIAAVFNAVVGVWLMLAPLGQNPSVTDFKGNTQEISGFLLFVNGLLSLVMAFIYVWLARLTSVGSQTALVIIQVFAVLNIVFGLFRLPYGWLGILINIGILAIVNTAAAKRWFSQTE
jgi:hypothetical protein